MSRIGSAAALLHAALQDIHAGLTDQAARLPASAVRDPGLHALFVAERAGSAARAGRIAAIGLDTSGPACLWMAGVLDDAIRDARATQPGRLLDIALAGAIRKGKAAEAAACDTAVALAAALADGPAGMVIAQVRDEVRSADAALLDMIVRLARA